jgi:protein-tyrosine phosphatase
LIPDSLKNLIEAFHFYCALCVFCASLLLPLYIYISPLFRQVYFIMGTVHGVYLKYVALSALSYAGYAMLADPASGSESSSSQTLMQALPALALGYSTLVNGAIAVLFKLEWGMRLIGKDSNTGQIPLWSYFMFFPFHIPTVLYTHVHTKMTTHKVENKKTGVITHDLVPVATEVQPGWWVGGCYGSELDKDWGGVIDLTVEFNETCRERTKEYLSMPTWDGVPASPALLDEAANFAVEARKHGEVMVHCAHGRGRSTTVMCACLVKAGLYPNWEEAFQKGIKPQRSVCKLNKRMRENLTAWQAEFVDGKKGQ